VTYSKEERLIYLDHYLALRRWESGNRKRRSSKLILLQTKMTSSSNGFSNIPPKQATAMKASQNAKSDVAYPRKQYACLGEGCSHVSGNWPVPGIRVEA